MRSSHALLLLAAVLVGQAAGAAEQKKGPRIAVEPTSFDFGRALPHKTLTKEFTVRNLGDADLVLEEVKTTCGCTAALPGDRRVAPGGRTPLHVSLKTGASAGRVERRVIIRSNDAQRGILEVAVSVTVVPQGP